MLKACPVVCSAEITSFVVLLLLCSVTDFVATLPVRTFLNFTVFGATVSCGGFGLGVDVAVLVGVAVEVAVAVRVAVAVAVGVAVAVAVGVGVGLDSNAPMSHALPPSPGRGSPR